MYKHNWTKAFVLAGLLALSSTASMAQSNGGPGPGVVELVVIPCTPQLRPDECGVKISAGEGVNASFTTNSNETVVIAPNTVVSVSGTGIISQSSQRGSIVNFASANTGPSTTGSIGGGGVGGGGQTNQNSATGGTNSGNETTTGSGKPVETGTGLAELTTTGVTGSSNPTSQ